MKSIRLLLYSLLAVSLTGVAIVGAQNVALPEQTPDAAVGQPIYEERCANCHGAQGMGDGELAPQSAVPPTAYGDPVIRRELVPEAMFGVITAGIMSDAGPTMPPFGPTSSNPIGEQDRWNLIATIFSLGVSAEEIAGGEALYATNCAECHGEDGREQFDLTDQAYWISRSNQNVFDALQDETITEHDYELAEDELWQVVDYARTFSYVYNDPLAALAPIEAGMIRGLVTNGSLAEPVGEPITVTLNAFSPEFQVVLTQTAAIEEDGSFQFLVSNVEPDLFYVVTALYNGVQFGSDFGELERGNPELELPFTVYNSTTDPIGVNIAQMHVILDFAEGRLRVSELYQFGNNSLQVYTGPTGDPNEGTVEIMLPEGAQNLQFNHTFGSIENLLPTDSIVQTDNGWADTLPVRPGLSSLNLLVRYELPYDGSIEFSHPVGYSVADMNMVMADAGVQLQNDGSWTDGGSQLMGEQAFLTYTQSSVPADSDINISLEGEPQVTAPSGSAVAPPRNTTTELLFGAGLLLLVVAAVGYYVNLKRQRRHVEPKPVVSAASVTAQKTLSRRKDALLNEIIDLEDAYERGELDEATFAAQRQQLMARLVTVWQTGPEQ
jgi:mono/diheme cytochrome c family protein